MQEPAYSICCDAIRLFPAVVGFVTWLYLGEIRKGRGIFVLVAILMYVWGIISCWCYWEFAISYAPTGEIAMELSSKDGASMLTAPIIMPVYVIIEMLVMWPVVKLAGWVIALYKKKKCKDCVPEDAGGGVKLMWCYLIL